MWSFNQSEVQGKKETTGLDVNTGTAPGGQDWGWERPLPPWELQRQPLGGEPRLIPIVLSPVKHSPCLLEEVMMSFRVCLF